MFISSKKQTSNLWTALSHHHWFHMCVVLDRVDGIYLEISEPQADITALPL